MGGSGSQGSTPSPTPTPSRRPWPWSWGAPLVSGDPELAELARYSVIEVRWPG